MTRATQIRNRIRRFLLLPTLCLPLLLLQACSSTEDDGPELVRIEAGADAQNAALEAFIGAKGGEVIEFGPGRYDFDTTLSLDAPGVTVRGAGMNDTVLNFANQSAGSGGEGILVTADDFLIEGLAVVNTRSDAIKVEGTKNATFRNVFIDWEGPPKTENGAYGLYPVQVDGVLIEKCKVRGSSDAGIYVGQSQNIIVRHNEAYENVAGIEIENSTNADVYGNKAWNNTGGLLVFSLPELPVKSGKNARVYDNELWDNNLPNFGKPGAIVSEIPAGSGLIIMANDNTEIWNNTIKNNNNINLSVISFTSTGREYDDPAYDPVPEGIWIHDNVFEGGGTQIEGALAEAIAPLLDGADMPDIVWDGVANEAHRVDGEVPPEYRIYVENNQGATFVNADLAALLAGKTPNVVTDASAFAGSLPNPPKKVTLEHLSEDAAGGA